MKSARRWAWVAAIAVAGGPSWAQEPAAAVAIDIRAQPIGDALNQLATQAGVQILFYSAVVEGQVTAELKGTFTLQEALTRLLAGTSLRYELINPRTIAIRSIKPAVTRSDQRDTAHSDQPVVSSQRSAQDPASASSESSERSQTPATPEPEELIVTGTRVPSRHLIETSPISTVTAEEIRYQGAVNLEAVIRDIPSAAPGRSATTNNGGNGNATLNLRNLGEARTLVLVDGKRLVGADFSGIPDINSIPAKMIERIEVVTGGASAVYGSDAIAGVVNFILRRDFDGVEADGQYSAHGEGDGSIYDASLLIGIDQPGEGNITAHIGYTRRDPVFARDRSWATPALASDGATLVPLLSAVTPGGRELLSERVFSADRELVADDGRLYDSSRDQFTVVPQERYALGASGHFDLAPAVAPYFRTSFTQNKVDRRLASAAFRAPLTVNFGNPLLSVQERGVLFSPGAHADSETARLLLSRRFVEAGVVQERNTYQVFQVITGVRGELGRGFSYDVSAQYGRTSWTQQLLGDISYERLQQGLLVDADGTCIDPSGGCVPIDVFTAQPGAITAEQADFFSLDQQANSETSQFVAMGSIAGELSAYGIASPWADDAVGIALGVEYRREKAAYRPDDNLGAGRNVVFGAIPFTQGEIVVRDAFAEIRAPLVQGRAGIQLLEANAGYRHSSYNLVDSASAYKYGLLWTPLDRVSLRASFQRAVRAPNIGELFSPPQPSADAGVDPCYANGNNAPTASAALCAATGVPAASYGTATLQCPSGQCTALIAGNPMLVSERSNTRSMGLVLGPFAASDLALTLDYFDIDVRGAISSYTLQSVLLNCYGTAAGQNPGQDASSPYCQRIVRDGEGRAFGGGRLSSPDGYVALPNLNIGFLQTRGFDTQLTARWDLSALRWIPLPGAIAVSVIGTRVASYEQLLDPTGGSAQECAGNYGLICGQPNPKWRTTARVTYSSSADSSVSLRWRWIDSVLLDVDQLSGTITDPPAHKIAAQSYLDLSGQLRVGDKLRVRAGISNVLDEQPPRLPLTAANASNRGLSNTFPGTYDLGRQFFVGLTGTF